jgi:hypothetical protein
MSQIKDGIYAYRFKGFAQDPTSIEYFLVGVGTLLLENKAISGKHRATYLRLSRGSKPPTDGHFDVSGHVTAWDEISCEGSAELVFVERSTAPSRQLLTGQFAIVEAGQGEYWLTSFGGASVVYGSQPAIRGTELVEGELRWIAPLPQQP